MLEAKFNNKSVFKILPTSEDHLKWHKLIEYVKECTDFPEEDKVKICNAYKFLSVEFGEKFLFHCVRFSPGFGQSFLNKAPWALKWVAWLADAFKILKECNLDKEILQRLNSKQKFHEGISLLELSYLFYKAGFNFLLDQEVEVKGKIKRPDLLLIDKDNNSKIYVELSDLIYADDHRITENYFSIVSSALHMRFGIAFCGKVSKFKTDEKQMVLSKIELAIEKCISSNSFVEINEYPLHIGIAPTDNTKELSEWALSNNYSLFSLSGDPINLDGEVKRIKNKIEDKAKQLNDLETNIIAIHLHTIFFLGGNMRDMFIEVSEELSKYPKLLGVLIYGDFSWAEEEHYVIGAKHLISTQIFEGVNKKTFFFIRNNHFPTNANESTVEKIYNSFKFGNPKEINISE